MLKIIITLGLILAIGAQNNGSGSGSGSGNGSGSGSGNSGSGSSSDEDNSGNSGSGSGSSDNVNTEDFENPLDTTDEVEQVYEEVEEVEDEIDADLDEIDELEEEIAQNQEIIDNSDDEDEIEALTTADEDLEEQLEQVEEDEQNLEDQEDELESELEDINPGLEAGDLDTVRERLQNGKSIFLEPECNAESPLDDWEYFQDMLVVQLQNWETLKVADNDIAEYEESDQDTEDIYNQRVQADNMALQAIEDLNTFIIEAIIAPHYPPDEDTSSDITGITDESDDTVTTPEADSVRQVSTESTQLQEEGEEGQIPWEFPAAEWNVVVAQYDLDQLKATEAQLDTLIVIDADDADAVTAYTNYKDDLEVVKADTKQRLEQMEEEVGTGGGGQTIVTVVIVVMAFGGLAFAIWWFKFRKTDDANKEGGNKEAFIN